MCNASCDPLVGIDSCPVEIDMLGEQRKLLVDMDPGAVLPIIRGVEQPNGLVLRMPNSRSLSRLPMLKSFCSVARDGPRAHKLTTFLGGDDPFISQSSVRLASLEIPTFGSLERGACDVPSRRPPIRR